MFSVLIKYDGINNGHRVKGEVPVQSFDSYNATIKFIDEFSSKGVEFVYSIYEHSSNGNLYLVETTDIVVS